MLMSGLRLSDLNKETTYLLTYLGLLQIWLRQILIHDSYQFHFSRLTFIKFYQFSLVPVIR